MSASAITVRPLRLNFDEPLDLDIPQDMIGTVLGELALSLTMPYLEPYLIRTMRVALEHIRDPQLAEDVRRFSAQEGHHFRNHAALNRQIRARFDSAVSARIQAIEAALEADYQHYTKHRSLRFNVTYAEGFEAMTCAGALAGAIHGSFDNAGNLPGGHIWAWHMAEEIEHRTVAFSVYEHLVGSYPYRIAVGTWSQIHYVRYLLRFARCMAKGLGVSMRGKRGDMERTAARLYLNTWKPSYHPANIEIPEAVEALLARYSKMVEEADAPSGAATAGVTRS